MYTDGFKVGYETVFQFIVSVILILITHPFHILLFLQISKDNLILQHFGI